MQLNQMRRKISWVTILLVLQRSPVLPWAKNALLFVGSITEKVWTWKVALPVVATSGGWHSLSGASSYVTSNQSNSATVQEGDSYSFTFFTRGYRAYSFKVEGLPSGLTYNGSSTSPTISGTPDAAGSYSIEITGYRWSGLRGSSTAVYTLNLEVEAPENPTASPLSLWSDSDTTDFGNGWHQSSWFGTFYGNTGGWTYHLKHQWIYLAETANGGLWIHDDSLGWLYTEKEAYPYLYRYSNGHWLYDLSDLTTRNFWDATDQITITP